MNARLLRLISGDEERIALAGDNLLVDLDLSARNLTPGQRLAIGEAVVEVTDVPHTGCGKFMKRYGRDAVKFVNSPEGKRLHLRGVYAKVVKSGVVRVGDAVRKVGLLAVVVLLAACGNGPGPDGDDLCPQTVEFGNFGCARVAGTVRARDGRPLAGVLVTLTPPTGATASFDSPSATTGAAGTFFLEVHRLDRPEGARVADTIPVYLRGVVPDAPESRDSLLVDVVAVPVGAVAKTVEADLVLVRVP